MTTTPTMEEIKEMDYEQKLLGALELLLEELRLKYPELTYANNGYDNIPNDVRARNQEGQDAIEAVLKEAVVDFVRFQNFQPKKDGSFSVRCQTRWSEAFTGVSYFPLEDFKEQENEHPTDHH